MSHSEHDEDRAFHDAFREMRERDKAIAPSFLACLRESPRKPASRGWSPLHRLALVGGAVALAGIVWVSLPNGTRTPAQIAIAQPDASTEFLLKADYGWEGLAESALAGWTSPTDFLLTFAQDVPPAEGDA